MDFFFLSFENLVVSSFNFEFLSHRFPQSSIVLPYAIDVDYAYAVITGTTDPSKGDAKVTLSVVAGNVDTAVNPNTCTSANIVPIANNFAMCIQTANGDKQEMCTCFSLYVEQLTGIGCGRLVRQSIIDSCHQGFGYDCACGGEISYYNITDAVDVVLPFTLPNGATQNALSVTFASDNSFYVGTDSGVVYASASPNDTTLWQQIGSSGSSGTGKRYYNAFARDESIAVGFDANVGPVYMLDASQSSFAPVQNEPSTYISLNGVASNSTHLVSWSKILFRNELLTPWFYCPCLFWTGCRWHFFRACK
jgi:hypothetical protein